MQDLHSGTITRAYYRAIYEESVSRCFILSPGWGKVRRSRIGGGERSEPIRRMLIMPYDTESKSRNVLASPLGEEGHEVAKGCTRVRMIMTLDVDVTAERRHYNMHCPLKGKRLTTFCASLALLQPLLSLTHWIFRSLMLPYKSSSHSAKCVCCAPLRSGAADWRSGPR